MVTCLSSIIAHSKGREFATFTLFRKIWHWWDLALHWHYFNLKSWKKICSDSTLHRLEGEQVFRNWCSLSLITNYKDAHLERFEPYEQLKSIENLFLIGVGVNHNWLIFCLFETQTNRVPQLRRGSIAHIGDAVGFVDREQRLDSKEIVVTVVARL